MKDVTSIVKKIAIFEVEGNRGPNLQNWYENLNSIPTPSVEPERVFQDVEELLPKLDHLYMMTAWTVNVISYFFYCFQRNLINGLKVHENMSFFKF
jgi:hypothetical protein